MLWNTPLDIALRNHSKNLSRGRLGVICVMGITIMRRALTTMPEKTISSEMCYAAYCFWIMVGVAQMRLTTRFKDAYRVEGKFFLDNGLDVANLRQVVSAQQQDESMGKIIKLLEEKGATAAPFYGVYQNEMYADVLNASFEVLKWYCILYLYFLFPLCFRRTIRPRYQKIEI